MFVGTQVTLPNELAGVRIRNTSLAYETTQFVSGVTPLWLLNHLLRTYVFADLLVPVGMLEAPADGNMEES
jgi:hypothetical protein